VALGRDQRQRRPDLGVPVRALPPPPAQALDVDTLTGRSSALATVPGARRVVIGGRARDVYVLTDDAIVRLDRDGRVKDRVALRSPLADITYDGPDILVGVGARGDELRTFDAALPRVTRVELAGGRATATTVTLAGARAPRGLAVGDHGRLLVSDGPHVAVYDAGGRRVESKLAGLPGGSVIDVRRSFSDADPRREDDPAMRNG
jgi:hypothetical protein